MKKTSDKSSGRGSATNRTTKKTLTTHPPLFVSFHDGTLPFDEITAESAATLRKTMEGWSTYITRLSSSRSPDSDTTYLIGRAVLRRGIAHSLLNEAQDAVIDLTRVIHMKVGDAETNTALVYRAMAYDGLEQNEAAISDWTSLLAMISDTSVSEQFLKELVPQWYVCRARLYGRQGNYTQTVVDCDRALVFDPMCAEAYSVRGRASSFLGKSEQVLIDCTKAIDLQGWPIHFYRRGLVYKDAGVYDLAREDFEQAHHLEPENELFAKEYAILALLQLIR